MNVWHGDPADPLECLAHRFLLIASTLQHLLNTACVIPISGACLARKATTLRSWGGGTVRPYGSTSPMSSNDTTPLHHRLPPCSVCRANARATMSAVIIAPGHM